MEKSKITFKMITDTHIEVFNNGEQVGDIYSDKGGDHGKPYPYNEEIPTLESIQICGFTSISPVWSCGVYHGTKDVCLRFNTMRGEYYDKEHDSYKNYVDKCFRLGKPQMIKTFNDWMEHWGYPKASQVELTTYDIEKRI